MYIAFWRWRSVVTREKCEDILEFRIESTTQVMLKNQSEFFFSHSPFYDLNMRYVIRTRTYLTRQLYFLDKWSWTRLRLKLDKAKKTINLMIECTEQRFLAIFVCHTMNRVVLRSSYSSRSGRCRLVTARHGNVWLHLWMAYKVIPQFLLVRWRMFKSR